MDIKNILEKKFNIEINSLDLIGEGYDSKAYLVNGEYIFKVKYSANKKKGYEKEKSIYDFLNQNLVTNIKVPNIEYSYISDEISILGYKQIKGTFFNTRNLFYYVNRGTRIVKKRYCIFFKTNARFRLY